MREIDIFKVLANPRRLPILDGVTNKKQHICTIITVSGKSQPTVSQHIIIPKNAGRISEQKKGTNIFIKASNQQFLTSLE
ncbi:MAG: hypothetical protein QXX20_07770 [Candidatus Thermoplasmatota archaeon]